VGYPILALAPDRKDLRRYVRDLQRVLVGTLDDFGIAAEARPAPHIGVWVENRKIASLGIHLSRWVTTHGFALNVRTDLDLFSAIVPCGLPGVEMVSMERLLSSAPELSEVAERVAHNFGQIFERIMLPRAVVDAAKEGG
jgi:lipoyl(octanoyl) transferase